LHSSQRGWRAVSRSLRRQDKYSICRSHFGSIVRSISCLRDGGIVSNAPGQRLLSKPMSHGRLCEVVIAANTVLPSAEQLCLVYHYCTLTWFAFITHTLDCTLSCMACCPPRDAILDIVCRLDPLSPTVFNHRTDLSLPRTTTTTTDFLIFGTPTSTTNFLATRQRSTSTADLCQP